MSDKDKVVEVKEIKEGIKKDKKPLEVPMVPYSSAKKDGDK